jgi:hypothetical protein
MHELRVEGRETLIARLRRPGARPAFVQGVALVLPLFNP